MSALVCLERAPASSVMSMADTQPLPAETLAISEVAALTGLSQDTLRYYEKSGLISPVGRSAGGQRRYSPADLAWIELLLRLRDTGMSIADMQCFAELRLGGEATVAARLDLLRRHRDRLTDRIQRLQVNGQALDKKIAFYEDLLGEV
jgi:DNA-binding transcriptional MerR regulator